MGLVDWDALPLSRTTTNRSAVRRSEPDLVRTVLAEPGTQVLLVHRGSLAIEQADADPSAGAAHLALAAASGLDPALAPASSRGASGATGASGAVASTVTWLYLGSGEGAEFLALVLPDDAGTEDVDIEGISPVSPVGALVAAHRWGSLRELGAVLSARDAGLATEAVALAAWHARNLRCPRCGEPTEATDGGWVRRCTNDASEHYPRTDPAVIMAVVDADERLLLGHAAQWAPGRFSTLAGYVEPGEPLEAAVRREVLEEVGIEIDAVEYRGSQPWPFPASLMLGFVAHAVSTQIEVDGVEVTQARWFTRAELLAAVTDGSLLLPSRASIARALIEDWHGTHLPGA